MHFFLQNSKGFPKCFHTTMLCLSHVYYSRQEPFPLPCVNAGSPTSNLYFWQSSPVPLSSETIQRSYFPMSMRTQDPKAQDRKQAGHWQQQYSLKTQKDWICLSGHQLTQQWEMLLHSLHIFSIYLPVGSTSKVMTLEVEPTGHSWAEVVAVQPSGVCSAAQLMLLGVKWVLRSRPRAECKDPGCPLCPALPTHN